MLKYVVPSGITVGVLLLAANIRPAPSARFSETEFQFGKVLRGTVVEHTFALQNDGTGPLQIQQVRVSAPLELTSVPVDIPPGEEGEFAVSLPTGKLHGSFDGKMEIQFREPRLPHARLRFAGEVFSRSPIEVSPMEAFFVAAEKGRSKQATIEIANNEPEPLQILAVEHPTERFTTAVETVEQGRRYRMTLTLRPDGPLGKHTETIVVRTSSPLQPVLKLAANTNLHPRVFMYPDAVDLGTLHLRDLTADAAHGSRTAQTLMLYQDHGADFQASFSTDIPALSVATKRDPQGDRYQTTLALNGNALRVGPLRGSLFIDTNDPESPKLTVPVSADIVD